MKTKQFLALLRFESRPFLFLLPLAVYLAIVAIFFLKRDIMFSIHPSPGSSFVWFLAGTGCVCFFPSFYWVSKRSGSGYEFLFSRAISKRILFSAKASLLLLLCSLPPLVVLAYSYSAPLLRVELPYHTPEHREETKRFYLAHFSGSYLEKDPLDREGNKVYVVLPSGRISVAWLDLFIVLTITFLIQAFTFLLWRNRFGFPFLLGLFVISQYLSARLGFGVYTQSAYEWALAWSQAHLALGFLILLPTGAAVQLFAFQRFRSTEVF